MFILILVIGILAVLGINSIKNHTMDLFSPTPYFPNSRVSPDATMQLLSNSSDITPTQSTNSLENIVKTNGGCSLPCFLGITPGITKWTEAISLFEQLEIKGGIGTSSNNHEYFIAQINIDKISILFNMYRKDDTVGAILLTIVIKTSATDLSPDFSSYSIKEIFLDLGQPSNMLLGFDHPHEGPAQITGYNFWVEYDNYGLWENYIGSFVPADSPELCPVFESEQIMMYLFSPDLEFLPWGIIISDDVKKLEEVSSISQSEFFRLSTQSNVPVCFKIKQ